MPKGKVEEHAKMKNTFKLLIAAILSLSVGVAFASPLLVSDLEIRPFIRNVQGPTAEFKVNVVYANFTVINGSELNQYGYPSIAYSAILNITNTADEGAKLLFVDFAAAESFANTSYWQHPYTGLKSYFAEGAWVDGVWYNLTWVRAYGPLTYVRTIYASTNVSTGDFEDAGPDPSWFTPYWKSGVQLEDKVVNDEIVATYINMNGTWVDVTGRINVTRSTLATVYIPFSPHLINSVVEEVHYFNPQTWRYNSEAQSEQMPVMGIHETTFVGNESFFNNYWMPHQSRLLEISGNYLFGEHFGNKLELAVATLDSGNLTLFTGIMNYVNSTEIFVNNTLSATSSSATQLKQVPLIHTGDSYTYDTVLGDNQKLVRDQWGIEVFVEPGS
jgi:hypothetical protein